MDKYIEVYNDNNIIQLNDHYENIFYQGKSHPEFVRTYSEEGNISTALIKIPSHYSFWFLYNNSDREIQVGMAQAGSNSGELKGIYNRFLLFRDEKEVVSKEFIEKNIELYWFTIGDITKKTNYGLEIYNKKGKLIFSSSQNYLRIADIIPFAEKWHDEDEFLDREKAINWSGNSSKKYGIHLGSCPSYTYRAEDRISFTVTFAVIGAKNKYIKCKEAFWYDGWIDPQAEEEEFDNYKYSAWTVADITGL